MAALRGDPRRGVGPYLSAFIPSSWRSGAKGSPDAREFSRGHVPFHDCWEHAGETYELLKAGIASEAVPCVDRTARHGSGPSSDFSHARGDVAELR